MKSRKVVNYLTLGSINVVIKIKPDTALTLVKKICADMSCVYAQQQIT